MNYVLQITHLLSENKHFTTNKEYSYHMMIGVIWIMGYFGQRNLEALAFDMCRCRWAAFPCMINLVSSRKLCHLPAIISFFKVRYEILVVFSVEVTILPSSMPWYSTTTNQFQCASPTNGKKKNDELVSLVYQI